MSKSPAYQWYPKDILASQRVACMDAKVECWYRRALDFCWVNGTVPANPNKFAAMVGKGCTPKAAAEEIIPMFLPHPEDPNLLIHERQEQERAKQAAFAKKQSENGKRGGRPRKDGKEKGLGFSGESQSEAQKSSSSSTSVVSTTSIGEKTPPKPTLSGSVVKPVDELATPCETDPFLQAETARRCNIHPDRLQAFVASFPERLQQFVSHLKSENVHTDTPQNFRSRFKSWLAKRLKGEADNIPANTEIIKKKLL